MSQLLSNMRRFSRSSSMRKNNNLNQTAQSPTSYSDPNNAIASPTGGGSYSSQPQYQQQLQQQYSRPASSRHSGSLRDRALEGDYTVLPGGGGVHEGRPISSATDASFDFANRPPSGVMNSTGRGGGSASGVTMGSRNSTHLGGHLSRTDQIVLQHFWEQKYQENARRDLHYLRFPNFPPSPGHRDLLPYCEIYHLVKTSPGANIISLGSANGIYIGFELETNSQLHIDLDDEWFSPSSGATGTTITHHKITFRPWSSFISDPGVAGMFRTWPRPLTIEFLEDQYQAWCRDLMSICWEGREIGELGPGATSGNEAAAAGTGSASASGSAGRLGGHGSHQQEVSGSQRGNGSLVDDGYASERSDGGI